MGSNAWKILKQNQGARQTYCIQLDSVVCKELEKDSSLRQIVICKTNGKLVYMNTPDQTKSTAEVKADME
jgi:transcription-repair coupling factor (superfamily II helicase)